MRASQYLNIVVNGMLTMNSMAALINFLPGTVSASAITHVVTAPYEYKCVANK